MKPLIKQFTITLMLIAVLSAVIDTAQLYGKTRTITFQTTGINEPGVKKLERKLKSLKGISQATANVKSRKITVQYDSSRLKVDQILNLISQSGCRSEETFINTNPNPEQSRILSYEALPI